MGNKTNWNIPVSKVLDDALEKAIQLDTHSTKSDFVRDVVRRKLEKMGFKPQVFNKQEKTKEGEKLHGNILRNRPNDSK